MAEDEFEADKTFLGMKLKLIIYEFDWLIDQENLCQLRIYKMNIYNTYNLYNGQYDIYNINAGNQATHLSFIVLMVIFIRKPSFSQVQSKY